MQEKRQRKAEERRKIEISELNRAQRTEAEKRELTKSINIDE